MKKILRKKLKDKLNKISSYQLLDNSSRAKYNIDQFLQKKSYNKIGIYNSFKNEIIIHNIDLNKNVSLYAPSYNSEENSYHFRKVKKNLNTVGKFNILEPTGKIIDINLLDLILIPGLGFDKKGNRLGRGKGFYDDLLKNFKGTKIGVCHHFQLINEIPIESWDIKMNYICTEKKLLKI